MIEMIDVKYEEFHQPDFKNPSKFFIRNALGDYTFFKTSSRPKAQEASDEEFGKGKYKVCNYAFNTGNNKEITAR